MLGPYRVWGSRSFGLGFRGMAISEFSLLEFWVPGLGLVMVGVYKGGVLYWGPKKGPNFKNDPYHRALVYLLRPFIPVEGFSARGVGLPVARAEVLTF